ncbi:uncharacterized protein K441DRAFT_657166 [Cenococcum geophilum 1.58]|uniref:uncharacterized protein n=1 Tax=Cenococcum geophilum 1.58 TaxID=794803 RepID=UPI00358F2730|nr:hypothetical protein K441DRAFT_657166 [Cenococcum geophilum 1.58]
MMSTDTSNASKQHPKEMLEKLGGEDAFYGKEEEPRNPGNVAGGLESVSISLILPSMLNYFHDVNPLATKL